ncbi:MAG TPA: class I adenylate-forming enzyme family protein [Acidimicrobiales bacterium]|nr:class I adenylate-forming enzyme family protein [Acidimicrobiales bacterium]
MTAATDRLEPSLHAACRRWPDRPALTFGGVTISYAELWAKVENLARAYVRLGVEPGDRIVCQLRDCPEHAVAINAAWACGAIHVGTDNDLTGAELSWLVDRTEAKVLVFQPPAGTPDPTAALRAVRAARPATILVVHGAGSDADPDVAGALPMAGLLGGDGVAPPFEPRNRDRHETGLLLLTSGTTGRPKAVMETLPACWAKMQFFADAFRPGPQDVHLLYLPVSHVFGMRLAMLALLSGGRLVLAERFTAGHALRVIAEERVTVLPGMPAHFTLLLGALDPSRHDTGTLRWAISAASNLPPPLVEEIYDRLGVDLLYVYGCSENFTVATTDRDEIRRGSVGRRVFKGPDGTPPDGTVAVLEPGCATVLAPGEIGELAFGAAHPVRYWQAPDAATDGWYRTGDLGRIDPDGTVYVLGRLKELINRGGLHVSPSEVETAVRLHPGVADSAVVATPDPVVGEAICACVVPAAAGSPTLADLREFLAPVLARHKLPDELCVVDTIPRTKIGKVDRQALAASVLAAGADGCERWRPR